MANDTAEQTAAPEPFGFQNIIGESPVLREAVRLAQQVAGARRTTVLLIGETGTGKELFARGIHYASAAADEPFVAINCAAIPDSLLESELFGHERGAFTGAHARKQGLLELAGAGTLFLDEVHHLPPLLQPKLLRALESRQVRRLGGSTRFAIECRIIAAASPLLEQVVAERRVPRGSLLPAQRLLDLAAAAARARRGHRRHWRAISWRRRTARISRPKSSRRTPTPALRVHRWPGNVRELKNVVERAAILSGDSADRARRASDDSAAYRARVGARRRSARSAFRARGKLLDDIVREAVALTLKLTGGNQAAAARLLGISRPTLAKKMVPRTVSARRAPSPDAMGDAGALARRRNARSTKRGRADARRPARDRAAPIRDGAVPAPRRRWRRRLVDHSPHRPLVHRRRPARDGARLPDRGAGDRRSARRGRRTSPTPSNLDRQHAI